MEYFNGNERRKSGPDPGTQMSSTDQNRNRPIIARDPEILGGTPCFYGTRVPFKNLLDYLQTGETLDSFLDDFPSVSREMAIEALETAKQLMLTAF
jgi:uncharacterized protein (DUF433 family)